MRYEEEAEEARNREESRRKREGEEERKKQVGREEWKESEFRKQREQMDQIRITRLRQEEALLLENRSFPIR